MKNLRTEAGFSLITAIFLLVVVAGLVVYMLNIRVTQQTTLVYGVQGARAMLAARSGIEWGIRTALVNDACPVTAPFVLPDDELKAFTISISCNESVHLEGTTPITVFQLTADAVAGSFGTLDYVQRRLQATVSVDPP